MATITLTDLIAESRSLLQEETARFFTDSEITRWINWCIRDFSSRVYWYEKIIAMSVTANVNEFNLDASILKVELIRWKDQYRIQLRDESAWSERTFANAATSDIPTMALLYPGDKRLLVNPTPSTSSTATTISGAHSSSVTTITVASTTDFPTQGRILVTAGGGNVEQIRYFGTTATTFTNCRRGDADTTASAYVGGEAVVEGRLVLYVRALPADISGAQVPNLPDHFVPCLPLYAAWRGELKRKQEDKAQLFHQEYLRIREEAMAEKMKQDLDMSEGVKDQEFGMGWYGIDG